MAYGLPDYSNLLAPSAGIGAPLSGGFGSSMDSFNALGSGGSGIDTSLGNPLDSLPGAGAGASGSGLFGISGLGANMDTLKLGLGGLQTIGSLWGAFNAASLAKKQYALQKQAYQQNTQNSIQSYNTHLDDIARSRAAVEGQSPDQEAAYIAKNQLTKVGG